MGATTFPKDALPGDAAEEKGPIARREIFGPDTGAFMEIEISEDRQQAAIKTLSFCGDPALTAEDITKGLAQLFGIEHGVLESTVRELAGRAQAAPDKVHRDIVIARATPPVPGGPGQIEYTFQADDAPELSCAGLRTALVQQSLDEVLAVELQTLLVAPGCELAVRTPPSAGEDGCDIFGQTLPAPVQEARVKAGVNVREEGGRILADAYGYVWIGDDRICARCWARSKQGGEAW